MEWLTKYFISFSAIDGGIKVDLSYATLILLAWLIVFSARRIYKSFQHNHPQQNYQRANY